MTRTIITFATTLLTAAVACTISSAQSGAWRGQLELGQMTLPLVFNFDQDAQGQLTCTIDSPHQGVKGLPTSVTLCTADSLVVSCPAIGATYSAAKPDATTLQGTFTQRGYSFPLQLTPDAPIEDRRPQNPKPPFPYTEHELTFRSSDGTQLSGTLVMPAESYGRPVAAVVMVTGSGPQNRNEELFEHKPFAVIADYLARQGIASLRYDDRGVESSQGSFTDATTYTFAEDARAAIEAARAQSGIGAVGLLGHSEGGAIAFMLGAEQVPDFVISVAGMAISARETLMWQNEQQLHKLPSLTPQQHQRSMQLIGQVFELIAQQATAGASQPIDVAAIAQQIGPDIPEVVVASTQANLQVRTPWFDTFLTIDPRTSLAKVTCPLLALNGTLDTQVAAEPNLSAIRQHAPHADCRSLTGLNHCMQHATTGEVTEYGEIRETIAPEVLDAIAQFVHTVGSSAGSTK